MSKEERNNRLTELSKCKQVLAEVKEYRQGGEESYLQAVIYIVCDINTSPAIRTPFTCRLNSNDLRL